MTATASRAGTVRDEVPHTLTEPAPRPLGFRDQIGLWGNLGVSLLGPVSAIFVLQPFGLPALSYAAAFTAVAVGTVLGSLLLGLSTVPGARTGAPAMVLLRGLFGARQSYLPTVLNLLQCIGWGTFELVVIADATTQLVGGPHWAYVIAAGLLATAMSWRPLGAVRVLRRYVVVLVLLVTVYLYVQLLRDGFPSLTDGSWAGFWPAADVTIAVAVSWVPLAADYSRHSRSGRAAFAGSFVGYSFTQIAYYSLGLVALATVAHGRADAVLGAFIAVPLGGLALGVLLVSELDEAFADMYSTVVSTQNLRPLADRRLLAVVVGGTATVLALVAHIKDYQGFLLLLGSVFVPLSAVFLVDYFLLRRGAWDISTAAPARWSMLLPWAAGFVAYQLVNPGSLSGWVTAWTQVQAWLRFTPASWMSASVASFAVAAAATVLVGLPAAGRARTVGRGA